MDTKKMIKRVEAMKTELAAIRKEVEAEGKRVAKLKKKTDKTREKLATKFRMLDVPNDGVINTKSEVEAAKLRKQIEAIPNYDLAFVGEGNDYPEDSILGALGTAQSCLNDLVAGKGKKVTGHFVGYEEDLAGAEDTSSE